MNYIKRAKQFRTKKRLGQNFLVDETTISTIIENANLSKEDTVVEIGPGIGFVTERLVEIAKKVIAIEIDPEAISELEDMSFINLQIIPQDILKTDISNLADSPVKIVANIPYYITSPILVHLLGEVDQFEHKNRQSISEIILMVQYEVARRIVANEKSPNKEYGTLSILCNYWAETELITKVPASCFYPPPKIDSALVKFKIREKPLVMPDNPQLFRKVIQAAFGVRRKNIRNALSIVGFSKDIVDEALKKLSIPDTIRGETLSIEQFKDLSNAINEFS